MIRTVRSNIVGLDLALGGGLRLLRRIAGSEQESATIVIRGGPGTGKSVLAADLAIRLSKELNADALYACVEILPSEVIAQRMGFDAFDPDSMVDLATPRKRGDRAGSHFVVGLEDIPDGDDGKPDLGAMLLSLFRKSRARGFNPKVVVVDSLIEGYGLGKDVPRAVIDGMCKIAIEQGWVLILVEESADNSVSPWMFAVDTVLSLRVRDRGDGTSTERELLVAKHRFGSCEPGPHRVLIERERVRVIPPLSAYRNAARDLKLPPPAKNRSLRIPGSGADADAHFQIANETGRAVVVFGPNLHTEILNVSYAIGQLTADRRPQSGVTFSIELAEDNGSVSRVRLNQQREHVAFASLHQFIHGDEWLERALFQLSRIEGPLIHLRIGPSRIVYDHQDEIRQAVQLVALLAVRLGWIVVLYGEDANHNDFGVRPKVPSDRWRLEVSAPTQAPGNRLRIAFESGSFFSPDMQAIAASHNAISTQIAPT